MSKNETPFRFKRFAVSHSRSSMKVGIDAVLIGAWGRVEGLRGLDIGTGCGVIALMAAQRNQNCILDAIDIDHESVEEAAQNFASSPWNERLRAFEMNVEMYGASRKDDELYDFILSNPPFFDSGIKTPVTARERARHQGELTIEKLIDEAERLLKPAGHLSIIIPTDQMGHVKNRDMNLTRICHVSDRPGKTPKRVMLTFTKDEEKEAPEEELLYIRNAEGNYSEAYKILTADFYLAF